MNIYYDSLFCFVDDFYKGFEPWYKKSLLTCGAKKRNRECKMSLSEIITILIAFHQSGMDCLMDMTDKMMLMKRSFIETIFSSIKLLGTLIHHRHRSPVNAFTHLFAGLISYQIRDDKPSLDQLLKLNP